MFTLSKNNNNNKVCILLYYSFDIKYLKNLIGYLVSFLFNYYFEIV